MSAPKPSGSASSKKSSSNKQPKVFDIRRPGKALASPTSRPFITPRQVKDDVLVTKSTPQPEKHSRIAEGPDDKRELMDSSKKVTIAPASTAVVASAPQPAVVATVAPKSPAPAEGKTPAPKVPLPLPLPETPAPAPVQTQTPPAEPKVATSIAELLRDAVEVPAPTSSAVFDSPNPTPPAATAQTTQKPTPASSPDAPHTSEEMLAGTAAPEVDMSRAVISTSVTGKRHVWRDVLVVIGLLLFVIAILDLLLDSGIVSLHGLPHTHLWKS
jgi:hypothetical protein